MKEKENSEVSEQLRFIGGLAERRIFNGDSVLLGEPERVWLKKMLEDGGLDLSKVEGKALLGDQAMKVIEILGKERAIKMVRGVVLEMLDSGGNVFGKGVMGDAKEVDKFISEYLDEQISKGEINFEPKKYKGDGTPGSNWKMNTVYRIEAVMSVANKLMWVVGADGVYEAKRRQGTEGVLKHVRERVLRGLERAGEVVGDIPRSKENIIRFLPKGGLSKILDNMVLA